jgi:hypothetical protein
VSYSVTLRAHERRLDDDEQLLLRLGTDADVDQTIKSSLGHYVSYQSVLVELGLPGQGALTLSVYLVDGEHSPIEFRAGPFQRAYRTTTVGEVLQAGFRSGQPTSPSRAVRYRCRRSTAILSCRLRRTCSPRRTQPPTRPSVAGCGRSCAPASRTFSVSSVSRARSPTIPVNGHRDSLSPRRTAMAMLTLKTEIPVEFDTIVDRRAVVHELALDGDEDLHVGDHVALVNDGVSLVAVITEIDDRGYVHLTLR